MSASSPTTTTAAVELAAKNNMLPRFVPREWPNVPFHEGEIALQKLKGVHERVMSYAPEVIRPYMPDQHREFYSNQPFIVAAARENQSHMWATLLQNGDRDFITSPSATTLDIAADVPPSDALYGHLKPSTDLGLLGIELETRRRNRVNGRIMHNTNGHVGFQVDQSFGNCPQYIVPRPWWSVKQESDLNQETPITPAAVRSNHLTESQMKQVRSAQTIFVASGYRGPGEDVRYGNDASHRGGPSGFLQALNERTLLLPEFAGNNHYNTLGNLQMDDRMGITIPNFEHGGLLQLSGTGQVDMDAERASKVYPGAVALVEFTIALVNVVPDGTLPIRWNPPSEQRTVRVAKKVIESTNDTSFYLHATDGKPLWEFQAGQHLPISLTTPSGQLERTYSLSDASSSLDRYRISVKREPRGKASKWLHNVIDVGSVFTTSRPAGDFVLEKPSDRRVVLISTGIGITPLLSMLHQLVAQGRNVVWIHGARDGAHDALRQDVEALVENSSRVQAHHIFSQPRPQDRGSFHATGRIDIQLVQSLVPDFETAEYFMCGSLTFMANMEHGLQELGVDSKHVHFETF